MKKEKKAKFQLEKFNVAKLNSLKEIKGGDYDHKTIEWTVILGGGSTRNCIAD